RGVGQRASFPMGNLTSANLLEANMRGNRQADRVSHLFLRLAEQFSRHYGSGDDTVGGLIPIVAPLFRSGVNQAAKHLITQNRSEDDISAVAVFGVYDCQDRCQEVAGMASG